MTERTRPQPPGTLRWILPVALTFLYVPLVIMVIGSFVESKIGTAKVFTFRWYGEVFQDPALLDALLRSVAIAGLSSLISTAFGLLGALGLDRWAFSGRKPLQGLSMLSLMLPELVLSLSLLSWFAVLGFQLNFFTVVAAHVTFTMPFVILVIGARLRGLDASYEDAARDLGANETQVLVRVTLPLLAPAVVAGFLLALLLSFDDFLITFYTNGAGSDTLPVWLYSLMKTGLTPKVQALSSLMLLASIVMISIFVKLRGVEDVAN